MSSERVVITGMGAVSCLGCDADSYWQGLVSGRSGIGPIRRFEASGLRNPEAGEVGELPEGRLPERARSWDRATRFAAAATLEAAGSAGLTLPLGSECGVVLATNFGGAETFQAWATDCLAGKMPGLEYLQRTLMASATDLVGELLGITGPRATLSLSCSSGAAAIGLALDWIRLGRAKRVVAGGFDALTQYSLAGLSCLRAVTSDKLQPFDKNRSGTVFGEGAGLVVLESESTAKTRGAAPLAVVTGWASNNNAYHLTAPEKEGEGYRGVIMAALEDARSGADRVDYVNAHGTGTRYNDPVETKALHGILGARAQDVPVSSIKAAISHTMGAAGALEAIATACALRTGILPPTLNWEERDPECDLDYIPNRAREHDVRCAISLSSGIGGNNTALVLEKYV